MKLRSIIVSMSLALGLAAVAPTNSADAHTVTSAFTGKSSTPFFFSHATPGKSTWNWVGWDAWGNTAANMYTEVGNSTTTIKQDIRCSTTTRYGSWQTVPAYTLYGSLACSSHASVVSGRVGITH